MAAERGPRRKRGRDVDEEGQGHVESKGGRGESQGCEEEKNDSF